MKRIGKLCCVLVLCAGGAVAAQEMKQVSAEKKSTTATVMKVDAKTRHMTVRTENGNELTLEVPQNVKRLNEIKKGDRVRVDYYESVAASLEPRPGNEAKPRENTIVERHETKLPSGAVAHEISGAVVVVGVDLNNHRVTVRRPDGDIDTIDVTNPEAQAKLGSLKPGDVVQARYTEAAVITVMRPGKGNKSAG